MSRITAPVSKLTRSINSAANRGLIDSHYSHGAVLMPKYAELLKKSPESDHHARSITTTHRPTPQPQPSKSHPRPLMQTFSSLSAATASPGAPTIDATLFAFPSSAPEARPLTPEISVVAADPANALPVAALTEVEGMGVDGVELRFAHDAEPAEQESSMLTNLWGTMESRA
ncbi:hypothetical protein BN1723_007316 [Verticillium longisporum]|uniref:Uncharacterized protein n=1 Tax=Verticillium longisporum TaxID=100787 RepID=A0A0G4LYJ7_VERLO|nr:hypothetical protein HYQ44_009977 [Verticillium longisporum]CRK27072.1 hypothetical protein BN1708_004294 [Verticillium longisporum]CRK47058.1 hypothetical protein BN1723_007316 [Verticillium longisporum]